MAMRVMTGTTHANDESQMTQCRGATLLLLLRDRVHHRSIYCPGQACQTQTRSCIRCSET